MPANKSRLAESEALEYTFLYPVAQWIERRPLETTQAFERRGHTLQRSTCCPP
jgi:hypothetical protein